MKKLGCSIKFLMLLIITSVVINNYAVAQTQSDIEQRFKAYQQNNFTEKVYVHTDKTFYVTGEIIWFKLYTVDAANKPFDMSKVAYVDVSDNNQNPILQGKISLKNGTGNGSFYIPLTLPNGNYRFRAYTSWMKNNSPELYFEKVITIVNPLKSPAAVPVTDLQAKYSIQFFPEGGELVNGLLSKVAFKITDQHGNSGNYNGAVINQQNDTVARFNALKFGMGSFMFTPVAGDTYRAVLKTGGTAQVYQPLPAVKARGYVMQVTNIGDRLKVNVSSTSDNTTVYCITHSHQQVVGVQALNTSGAAGASVVIAKSKLADGVNYITVFNSNRQPVCERLYFKRPSAAKQLNLGVNVQPKYTTRKPVNITVTAGTSEKPLSASSLSVAVYKIDSLQKTTTNSIYSYLWLSTDLKGTVENADYYFEHTDPQTDEALDNLMLTQGWRRFNWNKILKENNSLPDYLPEYTGHLITGKLTNAGTGKPAANIIAYLSSLGKRAELYTARSDSAGRLLFETNQFYGPREIVLQTNIRQDSIYHIEIQSPFSEQYTADPLPAFTLKPSAKQELKNYNLSMQVQNVYAGAKLRQYYNPGIDSSSFYNHPTKTYMLEDFTRFSTMEEVLREYVTDISVTNRRNHFHIHTLAPTAVSAALLDDEPLTLLDGVPVFDMDRTFAIDPLKVKKLETVSNRYFYGPVVFDGILSFTTYKGDLGGFELDPRAAVIDYEGLQLEREFYSPVYETAQQTNSRVPDFRNMLYWEPNAGTNANGKGILKFYTSDLPGKYIIVVEGITSNGEAGSRQVMFEVKR